MRDDLRLVDGEHAFAKAPDAALVDRPPRSAPRIEHLSTNDQRRTTNLQQPATLAGHAVLGHVVLPPARHAAQPLAHTGRAPFKSMLATRTSQSPIFIAAAQRSALDRCDTAKMVGPD